MCGRVSMSQTREETITYLTDEYAIGELSEAILLPRYNVGPGQQLLAVIHDGKHFRAGTLKWGFVPFFAKNASGGYAMINAKAETIAERSAYRSALSVKRCVILADGFYEWKFEDHRKIPYRIVLRNHSLFAIAGLWSNFIRPDGTPLYTCTLITTSANAMMAPIHERMPVILTPEAKSIWLDPTVTDPGPLTKILLPYDAAAMEGYEVSRVVNDATHDVPECIARLHS